MSSFDENYKKAMSAVTRKRMSEAADFVPGEDVVHDGQYAHVVRIARADAVRPGAILIKLDETGELKNVTGKQLTHVTRGMGSAINRPAATVSSKSVKTEVGTYKVRTVSASQGRFEVRYLHPDKTESFLSSKFDTAKEALNYGIESAKRDAVERINKRMKQIHDQSLPKGISPKMEAAIKFFKANAGGVVGQAAKGALNLARAEAYASEHGWRVEWDHEESPDMSGMEDAKEVLVAVLKDEGGEVLGSLGNIGDPGRNYSRVVEAELALEAMPKNK
jgi:hypothetical protein